MKKKQFESVCKKLLPQMPGYTCKGWLLYAEPLGHVLRGFCCDDSGFDRTKFTVCVFCLPLYVPTQHVYFLFGNRLKDERGCDKWWHVTEPDLIDDLLARIKNQGIPFLSGTEDPFKMLEMAQRLPTAQEEHKLELISYSLALTGDYVSAQAALDRLMHVIDTSIPWQVEMLYRAQELRQAILRGPGAAQQLLAEWEKTTIKNLGL